MSEEVSFPLSRQPKAAPMLTYHGPDIVHGAHDGSQRIQIRSDQLFHGQLGCTESCRLIAAETHVHAVGLTFLIKRGSLTGTFDPSGGNVSVWEFNLTFNSSAVPAPSDRRRAEEAGETTIRKAVRLEFAHEAVEHVPRAVTPDREPSPCEQALLEEKTFTHRSSLFVDIMIVHQLRVRRR